MKNKIKGILGSKGYSFADYARQLGITPQALQSKFNKETYKVSDFIVLAEMTGMKLAMIDDNNAVIFVKEDIKKRPSK